MGQIDGFLLEIEENTKNANLVKEIVLESLAKHDVITQEVATEYSEKWNIVILKRSWFEKWFKTFHPNGKDGYIYKFLKF